MRRSRPPGGIAGNPVLIGAATVLVVIVAMFLSYNANRGLPFVPTYQLKAQMPSAANLVKGNEVRIGGTRVGAVDDIKAVPRSDGTSIALLSFKLDKSVEPLPKDSTVLIRPRSALGTKYVQIARGTSSQGYRNGDTIPLKAATPEPVELDEFLNMFDDHTRAAAQNNLEGFGTALAGRGESLNTAIGALRPLLRDIVPVMRNLTSPQTNIRRFFDELGTTARIVAPAAETQAALFRNLDTTMGALRKVAKPFIQESITNGRPALHAAIEGFPKQRPFLANTEGLFHDLRPGVRALRSAVPDLADALQIGTPVLRRTPALNRRLASLLKELQRFSDDPLVLRGLRGTRQAVDSLNPTLRFIAPSQLDCNYATLWFRNVSSLLSEGDRNGTWQRFIIVATPQGPNSEGGPASAPAHGPNVENHVHTNPYPHTGAPGEPKECEAGNEVYLKGKTVTSNVLGTQPDRTESAR